MLLQLNLEAALGVAELVGEEVVEEFAEPRIGCQAPRKHWLLSGLPHIGWQYYLSIKIGVKIGFLV
tara:strand:+ start:14299 stop:14496 length:198 start_codon:yes stop_codon:yes gene_type:complete